MNVSEQVEFLLSLGKRLNNLVTPGDGEDYLTPGGEPLIPDWLRADNNLFPVRVIDVLMARWIYIKDFNTQENHLLLPNPGQRQYSRDISRRNIVLKSGRTGFTTYVGIRGFIEVITHLGYTALLAAHQDKPAQDYFQQVHYAWKLFPDQLGEALRKGALKLGKSSTSELSFPELNSRYFIETAGDKMAGIGQSLQYLHATEYSKWQGTNPKQVLSNLLSQLTGDNTEATVESRPNGDVGDFHERYWEAKRGANNFKAHFFEWWWNPALRGPVAEDFKPTDEELLLAKRYIHWRQNVAPVNCGLPQRLSKANLAWRRESEKEQRDLFKQEFAEDESACFLGSGNCPFSALGIQKILDDVTPIVERASGEGESENGLIRWREPEEGRRYIIFGDPASTTGTSRAVWEVIDEDTEEQVAEWVGRVDEQSTYAAIGDHLGKLYNNALLALETNLGEVSATVIFHLANYPNLFTSIISGQHRIGWRTDEKNRPHMLDLFADSVKNNPQRWHSRRLAQEAKTTVRKKGRIEAGTGALDDIVMSAAGCLAVKENAGRQGEPWIETVTLRRRPTDDDGPGWQKIGR